MIEALNEAGRWWASSFVPALVQNTLFLALVFGALYGFRHASAAVKYAIAAVGLVKLLLPPLVPAALLVPAGNETTAFGASTLLFSFSIPSAGAAALSPDTPARLDAAGALFVVWAVVAAWIVVRAVRSTWDLMARVRGAKPIVGEPAIGAASPRESRRIGVFKSPRIGMPLTIGLIPRRIYVPESWERWTPECRRAVLRHEIAHIHRRDGLFQALEILAQALYFFHPLVWVLNRRLRAYREMACDDASVGRDRTSRLGYSKLLLEMAETALRPPVACESASALMRRKHDLLARVAYQIKEGHMLFVSKKKLAAMVGALVVAMLPFSLQRTGGETMVTNVSAAGQSQENVVKKAPPPKHKKVSVVVTNTKLTIDGKITSMDDFGGRMAEIAGPNPDRVVTAITCDGDVTMARLYKVQKHLLDTGLVKVAYQGEAGKDLPVVLPDEKLIRKMGELSKDDVCHVTVGADGQLYVGEKKYSATKAVEHIEQCLQRNPNLVVSIHMDYETRYGDFVDALAHVKQAGCERVFINHPTG